MAGAIESIEAFVTQFEPDRFSVADAGTLVAWFNLGERLCSAGKTLSARVARSEQPAQAGHRTPADWLASVTGAPLGQAIDELKHLVETAEHHGFRQDRCPAARAEGRSEADEARRSAALHAARRCRTWTDPEGAFRLDAALPPEQGASLAAHLVAETNRHFEAARRSGEEAPREAYAADALVALVTGTGYLGPKAGPGRGRSDPKARVTLRVDLAALRRGRRGPGEVCEIPGVGPVALATAREFLGEGLVEIW